MAEEIRLSIVYETSQAVSRIAAVDRQLDKLKTNAQQSQAAFKGFSASTRTLDAEINRFNASVGKSQAVFAGAKDRWATGAEILASMQRAASKAGEAKRVLTTRAFSLDQAMGRVNRTGAVTQGRLQSMARAGATLSAAFAGGRVSAGALGVALGKLAGSAAVGALGVAVANVVQALEDYKRISLDITNTVHNLQTAARDAQTDVARLLGEAPEETKTEKAVKRLRDAIAQMRSEAARLHNIFGGGAGRELSRQADVLEAQIPSIGGRAAAQDARERARQAREFAELRAALQATDLGKGREVSAFEIAGRMPDRGRIQSSLTVIAILEDQIREMAEAGKHTGQEFRSAVDSLMATEKALVSLQRKQELFTNGLQTMADSIEDFVLTGTFAFGQFIENIFRLLYRDFTQDLISGVVSNAINPRTTGTATPGAPVPAPSPSVAAPSLQMNFNVADPDPSAWIERHGAAIASAAARKIGNSQALRTRARIR